MKALTFDDICLVPQYNNVGSRLEPKANTQLTSDIPMDIPIVASNMESVTGPELADVLIEAGSVPIFPRMVLDLLPPLLHRYPTAFFSWGVRDPLTFVKHIVYTPAGVTSEWATPKVCLDIAHGHSSRMEHAIKLLKDKYPRIQIIAGSVCTARAVHDLVNWGADAIRVGIGPGAACTTRTVTGFGIPQFSAILECSAEARRHGIPIIADGGIRTSGDIVKALAAGASSVMIGKLFAATVESAAQKRTIGAEILERGLPADTLKFLQRQGVEALYRGQASSHFQREGMIPEGEEEWIEVTGPAKTVISTLVGGIKSGMTYGGASTIEELQRKAEFREVNPSYMKESEVRL